MTTPLTQARKEEMDKEPTIFDESLEILRKLITPESYEAVKRGEAHTFNDVTFAAFYDEVKRKISAPLEQEILKLHSSLAGAARIAEEALARYEAKNAAVLRMEKESAIIRNKALEEAAEVCEAYKWFEDKNRSPDDSNLGCAESIRALKSTDGGKDE